MRCLFSYSYFGVIYFQTSELHNSPDKTTTAILTNVFSYNEMYTPIVHKTEKQQSLGRALSG